MRPLVLTLCAALALVCAACSSSGTSGSGSTAGAGTTAPSPVGAATTSSPRGSTGQPSNTAAAGGITMTGAFTATVTVNLCTDDAASIAVHVAGDPEKYLGAIGAKTFAFVGPEAADYSLAAGQATPMVSAGGTSFTVHDVKLVDLISGKSVTATGTVTCP